MIVDLGLLGFFESQKLVFGEKVTVVIRTSKNGDRTRNCIVFDTGHCLTALGTYGVRSGNGF